MGEKAGCQLHNEAAEEAALAVQRPCFGLCCLAVLAVGPEELLPQLFFWRSIR